jgi:hypothetical protein
MKQLFLLIIVIFLAFGCKKSLDLKGSITGGVELREPYNADLLPINVKVTLKNNLLNQEVYTNEKGIFLFNNIEEGYYDLTFSYTGYGTYQIKNYAFIGFGKKAIIEKTTLYKIPEFVAQKAEISLTGGVGGYTILEGFVTNAPGLSKDIHVSLFLDKTQDVSPEKYVYCSNNSDIKWVQGDTIFIKDFIHNLPKGEKWYVGIYFHNYSDHQPPTSLKKAYETIKLTVQ